MNAQGWRRLQAMDRRTLLGMVVVLLAFLALEAWMLVLRHPLNEWRSLVLKREVSEAAPRADTLPADIDKARQAIDAAQAQLKSAGMNRSDDDTVLFLISTLDRVGQRRGVGLGQVQLIGRRIEGDVQIITFEAEARGPYLELVNWLTEVEPEIAPLTATDLRLTTGDEGHRISLRVKFTAFLPIPEPAGGPR